MIQFGGLYLPEGETHLVEWMRTVNRQVDGKQTYQFSKLEAALAHVKNFRIAVDVGAHAGLWSMHLAKRFAALHAFEPVAEHRRCFAMNVAGFAVRLHPCALGKEPGRVSMHCRTPGSSGDTAVAPGDEVEVRTLDSFGIECLDFLKIDCEGYELPVLQGAVETLARCRPVVIVEQKKGHAERAGHPTLGAVRLLECLGAKLREEIAGDYVLSWD